MARSRSIKAPLLATLGLALVCVLGAAHAGADPVARDSAANTMIASITDVTPAGDTYVKYVRITGQVQSPSHKYAPRKCRVNRTIDVTSPTVGGSIAEVGSSYPSNKTGHFRVEFTIDYAGTASDGTFLDGSVRGDTGGTATFILDTDKHKVQKVKGDPFRLYTCRPLRLTVQITVPPIPGS